MHTSRIRIINTRPSRVWEFLRFDSGMVGPASTLLEWSSQADVGSRDRGWEGEGNGEGLQERANVEGIMMRAGWAANCSWRQKMSYFFSSMESPHWLIVAGAVLLILGFIGLALFGRSDASDYEVASGEEQGRSEPNLAPVQAGDRNAKLEERKRERP